MYSCEFKKMLLQEEDSKWKKNKTGVQYFDVYQRS